MKRFLRAALPVFPLVLFAVALWVLHHELASFRYADVVRHVQAVPLRALLISVAFSAGSYLVLTGYDFLGFVWVGRKLPAPKIALTSFISYAFSNSVGHSMLTGGSVRFRLYSSWDVSGEDISKIVAFCSLTFWVGFLALGSVLFLTEPLGFPGHSIFHLIPPRTLGLLSAAALLGYFYLLESRRGDPLELFGWQVPVPSMGLGLAQIALSALDWTLSASVLFVLLPPSDLRFPLFLGIYLLSQVLALASQVPAGAAVFETIMVMLLSPHLPAGPVLGALVVYRGVYCVLPLGIASILFGVRELFQRKKRLLVWLEVVGSVIPRVAPTLFSMAAFISGAVLLFSGATPAVPDRLRWLDNVMPLGVIEISHFVGSIAGAGLLLLARGLQRRLDAAYRVTEVLLALGIAGSLLKGLDYEEALILSVMLVTLWLCRENFYRKAVLQSERFTPGWLVAIAMVLGGSVWLGLFAHKQVEYSQDLWWHFSLHGDAPRFMRASVGAVGLTLIALFAILLRPAPADPNPPTPEEMEIAKKIAHDADRTSANLSLLGDKSLLFNDQKTAFLMYGVQGRSWVAMGDPVGPESERAELVWRFRELSDAHDGWMVFYEVGKDNLPLYVDMGLRLLKLGEEARVDLQTFSLQGNSRKNMRSTMNQVEKNGGVFEMIPAAEVPSLLPELKAVSDSWMEEKRTKEKGFSLGFFDENYLKNFPLAVVKVEGHIVAFANIWTSAAKAELSVDLMRYNADAPGGTMEFLLIKLMQWGAADGYRWFNLGMAPLSGLENRALAPLWNRAGSFLFNHGEDFYNFEGLRAYKEKFHPVWEPKYLAAPAGFRLPAILTNVSTLISGGLRGLLAK